MEMIEVKSFLPYFIWIQGLKSSRFKLKPSLYFSSFCYIQAWCSFCNIYVCVCVLVWIKTFLEMVQCLQEKRWFWKESVPVWTEPQSNPC